MCNNENHKSSGGKPKSVHLADVVFYYNDPYLKKRIYLHTDLTSYAKDSISTVKLRDAFKSLCMTIECAKDSDDWRAKYSIESGESVEEFEYFLDSLSRYQMLDSEELIQIKVTHQTPDKNWRSNLHTAKKICKSMGV